MNALEVGRQQLDAWNRGALEPVFAAWDQYIVVRPDPDWPERAFYGRESAQRFYRGMVDAMGQGLLEVEEEVDLGDRAFWRLSQTVHSASGVEAAYSWSLLITMRHGEVIMIEFFIDDSAVRAELGISRDPSTTAV